MNFNHKLTETDFDDIDIKSSLENQIQNQEMKDSSWRFDKNISMTIHVYKTRELNSTLYKKVPLRSSAILNIENADKHCFIWSALASVHPRVSSHANRVSNCQQYFIKIKH